MLKNLKDRVMDIRTTGTGLLGTAVAAYCAAGHPMDLETAILILVPVLTGALVKPKTAAVPEAPKA